MPPKTGKNPSVHAGEGEWLRAVHSLSRMTLRAGVV